MHKLLSVIVPTRNSGEFFADCIKSLNEQVFQDFDLIIVDGGSTDETLSIAQSAHDFCIIQQNGLGLASAWNQGILASESEYIAFLDSDDFWEPDTLQSHMGCFSESPEKLYSIGKVKYFLQDSSTKTPGFKNLLLEGTHLAFMPGCFVGRRSLFSTIGLFDEDLSVATDIQWFDELKSSGLPFINLDKHVLNKRVHSKNLSYTSAETSLYSQELLKLIHRRLHKKYKNA